MLCVCGGHTLWASGVRAAGWSRVGSMSHNRRQTRSPCERRLDHHPRCDRPAAHCAACGRTCGWDVDIAGNVRPAARSEEHTSELQSLMRISYAVFCLKKKTHTP